MRAGLAAAVACAALVWATCSKDNAQRGGAIEEQLAAAAVAADAAAVKRILASGADPNKVVKVDGHYQAPWKLALERMRPSRGPTIEIVQAMLAAHANPEFAWGEGPGRSGGYYMHQTTPMSEALQRDAPDVARALLAAGLDPRLATIWLVDAAENRQAEIVHVLVEGGVPVNPRNGPGTPLLAAINNRDVALMIYLEEHGAREKP